MKNNAMNSGMNLFMFSASDYNNEFKMQTKVSNMDNLIKIQE